MPDWDKFKSMASNQNNHVGLFLVAMLVIHGIDASFGFSNASIMLIGLLYAVVTVFGAILVFQGDPKEKGKVVLISILAMVIPRLITSAALYSNVGLKVVSSILLNLRVSRYHYLPK